jgi:hypothetical protein
LDVVPTGDGALGGLTIVDEPDMACTAAGGTTTTVYMGPVSPPISRLRMVAARRVAGGPDVGGFVTFNVDGTSPSSPPTMVGAVSTDVTSEDTAIGAVGSDPTDVVYQRFDPSGNLLGPPITVVAHLSSDPVGVAIGGGGGNSLVVWGAGGGLYAAGINAGALAGAPFQLATNVYTSSVYATIVPSATGYAIAWTGDPVVGVTESSVAFASATALTGPPTTLTISGMGFKVRRIVASSSGYVLLVDGALAGQDDVYVIPLNGSGQVAGAAHRLVGSDIAEDMAILGGQLGVVASKILINNGDSASPGHRKLFRPLDLTGKALGSWICVGADEPGNVPVDMAIDADGTGFAVMSQDPTGAEVLTRFNAMGQ